MFDVLIIGGGVSGVSCALVVGSAHKKPYAEGKRTGIFTHQKTSSLQDALFNNAYGIAPGTLGQRFARLITGAASETFSGSRGTKKAKVAPGPSFRSAQRRP